MPDRSQRLVMDCSNNARLLLVFWLFLCLVLALADIEVLPKANAADNHLIQLADLREVQLSLFPTKAKETKETKDDKDAVTDEWIDSIQREMTFTVDKTARWLDQFFGDFRALDDQPAYTARSALSIGRLTLGPKWGEADGWDQTIRLRTRFYLPNTDNRVSAIIGRLDADEFLAGVDNARPALIQRLGAENDWFVGVGYDPVIRKQQRLSLGAGFRGGLEFDPYLRARYLVQTNVTEKSQLRWQSVIFWRNSDGLGASQRLDYEISISQRFLGRWSGRGTYAGHIDGIRWHNSASLFYLHSEDRAYATEVWTLGETNKDVLVEDYGVRGIYRTRFLREWFFIESWVGSQWPREYLWQARKQQWVMGLQFEILFGQPFMQRGRQRF